MGANSFISNFKIFLKGIIFLAGAVVLLYYVGEHYEEVANRNEGVPFAVRRFNEFYEQERNSIDMVFIGSSHSYCTFDPEIFDSALETSSFQMGTPLQYPATSYYVLKEVLNYQEPSIVVFEIYWDMIDESFNLLQADWFLEALQSETLEEEYINEVFPIEERIKYHTNIIRYQGDVISYYDRELKELAQDYRRKVPEEETRREGTEYYRSKGYAYADYVIPEEQMGRDNQFYGFDGKDWDIHEVQLDYIEKFIDLARANNIELIFVTAPVANVSMEMIVNYDVIYESIKRLSEEHNVPYIDYNIVNMEEGLLENKHFRDDAHLNHSGVEIVDAHFINWMLENELLESVLDR
ncbi:hypothetical protein EDC19_0190 [Natranaerovirga hydrolytica]|uniref:SGNH/GDSL hydrolase family protein n=1 Tax=Natranaerovirga hydrolytica TaxID=680378 RepID=A0A4R1MX12_9FIRM|nr:SGNH/GDSL hydrolase family protein [Natranaerovirga hydrolytica]TCK97788.1 hypothetical protein EDC19_0190 [Natranaerovirga hydrolytica]